MTRATTSGGAIITFLQLLSDSQIYISKQAELRVNQGSGLQILSWSGGEFAAERRSVEMVIV